MTSTETPSSPTMPETYTEPTAPTTNQYVWTEKQTTRRAHLLDAECPQRPVAQAGEVEMKLTSLCGCTIETEPKRPFKGFEVYRDVEWCEMCKNVYELRVGEGRR